MKIFVHGEKGSEKWKRGGGEQEDREATWKGSLMEHFLTLKCHLKPPSCSLFIYVR